MPTTSSRPERHYVGSFHWPPPRQKASGRRRRGALRRRWSARRLPGLGPAEARDRLLSLPARRACGGRGGHRRRWLPAGGGCLFQVAWKVGISSDIGRSSGACNRGPGLDQDRMVGAAYRDDGPGSATLTCRRPSPESLAMYPQYVGDNNTVLSVPTSRGSSSSPFGCVAGRPACFRPGRTAAPGTGPAWRESSRMCRRRPAAAGDQREITVRAGGGGLAAGGAGDRTALRLPGAGLDATGLGSPPSGRPKRSTRRACGQRR